MRAARLPSRSVNREVTLPLIVDDRGALQVSAADVSKLLRTVGARWLHLVEAGEQRLDEDTVAALTIELAKLADRIDAGMVAVADTVRHALTRPRHSAAASPRLSEPFTTPNTTG